jgi:hypothetical protein
VSAEQALARRRGQGAADALFALGFTVYAAVAVALLLSGLSSLAPRGGAVGQWEALGPVATGVAAASGHAHPAAMVALDYGASALNLALGLLLLWLQPRNWTARLLAVGMIGTAAAFNLHSHGVFVEVAESWVNILHFGLHAVSGVAYLHGLLLFPDGRLPGGWARKVLWGVYGVAAVEIAWLLAAGPRLEGAGPLTVAALIAALPFSLDSAGMGLADIVAADAAFFMVFFGLLVPLVGLTAQVQRYRRATAAEVRQQSRLLAGALTLAFGLGLAFTAYAVTSGVLAGVAGVDLHLLEAWVFRIFPLLFVGLPLALFAGLRRSHLWDVDRILNRTMVYGMLTGILGAVYLGGIVTLGRLLDAVSGGALRGQAAGLSMLAVAALFRPARRRIQDVIDRRFYRARYDAAHALEEFGRKVTDTVAVDHLAGDLLDAVDRTLQPSRVELILQGEEGA